MSQVLSVAAINPEDYDLLNKKIPVDNIQHVPAEIYEVENFLSKEDCQRLIFEITSKLRPSTIASSGEYDLSLIHI